MTASVSLLLVAGYSRELTQSRHIPLDVIREINNFLYEIFPHLFVIKTKCFMSTLPMNSRGPHGIEYIDMLRKVSTHLNILNVNEDCFIKDLPRNMNRRDSGLTVVENFHLPSILHKILPANVRESKKYTLPCTAIFKIGGQSYNGMYDLDDKKTSDLSSVIVIDHNSIYSKDENIVNGYQLSLPLPLPNNMSSSYQLAYDSTSSTLYAMGNEFRFSSNMVLFCMPFNLDQKSNIFPLNWKIITEKEMEDCVSCDGNMMCIPSMMSNNAENEHLMFVHDRSAYLFDLHEHENWIEIKNSNFDKNRCGMCFDSIRNCVYAGCGEIGFVAPKIQRKIDVYDFHKNRWFGDILPAIASDIEIRRRPKFWIQNHVLFVGGGRYNSIPDVKFVDLRENKKQWKVFENQWREYFVMENEKQEQLVCIERVL